VSETEQRTNFEEAEAEATIKQISETAKDNPQPTTTTTTTTI
jgi:hypothetical protein